MTSKMENHRQHSTEAHRSSPQVEDQPHDQPLHLSAAVQRARRDPASLSHREVLQLQRTLGNQAVTRLLARKSQTAYVQRDVVSNDNPNKVILDRFNSNKECAQDITAEIYKNDSTMQYDDIFDRVLFVLNKGGDSFIQESLQDPEKKVKLSDLAAHVQAKVNSPAVKEAFHNDWLAAEGEKIGKLLRTAIKSVEFFPLMPHQQALKDPLLEHFKAVDANMLWRFSSTPSKEFIQVTSGTSYEEILRVVAAHSGGNDKSNPNVITLSFGRNIGALLGTAASPGGDKHVTNIIDKAAYLYGIDINSLKGKGVTAHPALGRAISLFESEYILVSTPGNPPHTLDSLATVKYENPLKNVAGKFTTDVNPGSVEGLKVVVEEMGTVEPEVVEGVKKMPAAQVQEILKYATAVNKSATFFQSMVRDKDPIIPAAFDENVNAIKKYIALIKSNLVAKK